jgi:hypothetical protein
MAGSTPVLVLIPQHGSDRRSRSLSADAFFVVRSSSTHFYQSASFYLHLGLLS